MARAHLEPRADREIFVVPLEVRPEHIDDNGHVNNVVYVGWLQDAGTAHWNARFDAETRARWSWFAVRPGFELGPGHQASASPRGTPFSAIRV